MIFKLSHSLFLSFPLFPPSLPDVQVEKGLLWVHVDMISRKKSVKNSNDQIYVMLSAITNNEAAAATVKKAKVETRKNEDGEVIAIERKKKTI